ncbi:MAG TPA: hypothetical protein VFP50_18200 [Anaeromyxobacteraceae bacterium]|nr:hypothetical protein [Anaeromyxobacteraceae bacterium]
MPSQQLTVTAAGLYLAPNDLGDVPPGALAQADNAVISREGVTEPRRGLEKVATKSLARLFPFKTYLIGWAASGVLSRSSDSGVTWTDYAGTYPAPGSKVRAVEASGNLYFTSSAGIQRLDSATGTPELAGVPAGLDAQVSLGGVGSAVPAGNQVAYRFVWGKRDANGNLLLGSPTGRATVANAGATTQDITVSSTIPKKLPAGAFYQVYRSPNSGSATVSPSDELGLIYEGTPPGTSTLASLSRSAGVVTATTTSAHNYVSGSTVTIPASVNAGSGLSVAVGYGACSTSPDGVTWTSRTMPAGNYTGVTFGASLYCAAGSAGAATSPDGITWTARTSPAFGALVWSGTQFVGVGVTSACATSPDGITWTARTGTLNSPSSVAWNGSIYVAVSQNYGTDSAAMAMSSPDGITWTARTIGIGGYSSHAYYEVAWTGTKFVAVGFVQSGATVYPGYATSTDGITWSAAAAITTAQTGAATALALNGGTVVAAWTAGGNFVSAINSGGSSWNVYTTGGAGSMSIESAYWVGDKYVAVGQGSGCATSPDGITWTARTISPAGTYYGVTSTSVAFSAGDKLITSTPGATTFTYTESGGAGSVSSTQMITPLTVGYLDSVPSGFIGAALYTNPSQGTIQASADRIALCQDIASFRGHIFAANITYPSRASVYLLAVGGTGGIQAGDTVTIDGVVYTADASTESSAGRFFKVDTSGTPAQNIASTAQSLIRVINRASSSNVTARYLSGADDVPGLIYLEESTTSATMTMAFSRPTVWSVQSQKGPENRKNQIRWSPNGQPDSMPLLNFQDVGSMDRPIQKILSTRDMLVIVKDDGMWRLTGWNGIWDIQPLDPTQGTPSSNSLIPFENAVFGLLDAGVARSTESGVEIISTPVYNAIEPLLAPAISAVVESAGFGIAYHSSHKYILWLPSAATDTLATQAYVYDSWTNTWTRWTPPAGVTGWAHGLISPTDDRMYMVDGTSVYRERKALDDTDLVDGASDSIKHTIKFTPHFGQNPGAIHRFREIALIFRRVKFGSAEVGFSTNLSPIEEVVQLSGGDYGCDTEAQTQVTIRVLVPLEKSRASQLNVRFTHSNAGAPCQLQGVSVIHTPTSTRVSR